MAMFEAGAHLRADGVSRPDLDDVEQRLLLIVEYLDTVFRILDNFVEHDNFTACAMANLTHGLESAARELCDCRQPVQLVNSKILGGYFAISPEFSDALLHARAQTEAAGVFLLGSHAETYAQLLEQVADRTARFAEQRLLPLLSPLVKQSAGGHGPEQAFGVGLGRRPIHRELTLIGETIPKALCVRSFDDAREQLHGLRTGVRMEFARLRSGPPAAADCGLPEPAARTHHEANGDKSLRCKPLLEEGELPILQLLGKSLEALKQEGILGRLVDTPDIRTLRKRLKRLETLGLILRAGKGRSGYGITDAGRELLNGDSC